MSAELPDRHPPECWGAARQRLLVEGSLQYLGTATGSTVTFRPR